MKTLVAITSCARDVANGVNQAVRETWAARLAGHGIDYKFFIGNGKEPEYDPQFLVDYESHKRNRPADANVHRLDDSGLKLDEILLDCNDSWLHLAHKMQESRKWAIQKGYDYIFKIDVDCILDVARFTTTNYWDFDYWGTRGDTTGPLIYAGGWVGYGLSRKAALLTVNAPVTRVAEDCWTGEVMKRHGVYLEGWKKPVTLFLGLGHARYTAEQIKAGAQKTPPPPKVVRGVRPISKTQKRMVHRVIRRAVR